MSRWAFSVAVMLFVSGAAASAHAQQSAPARPQVISANPFGLLLGLFNAEYERRVSESTTAGVGGSSFYDDGDTDYVNADVFYRFYPSGKPLDGFAFGAKAGITKIDETFYSGGTYFGLGFDTNWSWLMGKNDNFYIGVGFGLKRLFGVSASDTTLEFIPTIRIVNVGFAF